MSEEILGIFPGWIRDKSSKWIKKVWTCKLFFTTTRLIVGDMKKRLGEPQTVWDPHFVFSHASARDRAKVNEVSLQSILEANSENFEILYSEIAAVELKKFFGHAHRDLLVFTRGNLDVPKYEISIAMRSRHMDDFFEFVRTILPDKV